MNMKFDTGYGWVHRRFAKPLATGSIPARVSIYLGALDVPRLRDFKGQPSFWLGRIVALWILRAPENHKSFRAGLLYSIETVKAISLQRQIKADAPAMSARDAIVLAEKYKAELIAAKKEISALKRKPQHRRGDTK